MSKSYTQQDVQRRLKNLVEKDYVSDRNAELLQEFAMRLEGREETSPDRQVWYISKFSTLLDRHIKEGDGVGEIPSTNLDEITEEDLFAVISNIKTDERDYSDKTINDFKGTLKMFYKLRHPLEIDRPKRVKKILQSDVLTYKKSPERKRDPYIFTPKHIEKMSEVAQNPRDSLLPYLLLDVGGRTSEYTERTLDDFERKNGYWVGTFHDAKENKDDRTLPLMHCQAKFQNWMEHHPRRDENDAPLLTALYNSGSANYGKKMSGTSLNKVMKRLAKRAKDEYPELFEDIEPEEVIVYDFRHSSATWRGTERNWGLQRMMWWFSWKSTKRPQSYLSEDNERMLKSMFKEKGVVTEEEETNFDTSFCSRCEEIRSADAKYCDDCGLPLDSETAVDDSALRDAGEKLVEMKLDEKVDDEELEELVKKVKEVR